MKERLYLSLDLLIIALCLYHIVSILRWFVYSIYATLTITVSYPHRHHHRHLFVSNRDGIRYGDGIPARTDPFLNVFYEFLSNYYHIFLCS